MSSTANSTPVAETKKGRTWMPRMWIGMCFRTWLGLLIRNGFAVSPKFWIKGVLITLISLFNSGLWLVEQLVFGLAIRRTKIEPRPLIVLGHWRSGTTWLHELLGLDPQFTSPSTYETMAPNHFTVSRFWVTRLFYWLLPERRPMDNMPMGWDRPQEDEFAICNLGVPSPYLTIAFPNHGPSFWNYLTLEGLSAGEIGNWKRALYGFLQKVTFVHKKRIILKSPPHTGRVRTLLEMFPDARFVYLVRDPHILFPSTVHLWKRLYETHGMQVPNFDGVEEYVLETFTRLMDRFEADRHLIPAGRLYEMRYEDLVADPLGRMRALYEQLELGDFEKVRGAIENYSTQTSDYKTNRYEMTESQRDEVNRRWKPYIEKYGYQSNSSPSGRRI